MLQDINFQMHLRILKNYLTLTKVTKQQEINQKDFLILLIMKNKKNKKNNQNNLKLL